MVEGDAALEGSGKLDRSAPGTLTIILLPSLPIRVSVFLCLNDRALYYKVAVLVLWPSHLLFWGLNLTKHSLTAASFQFLKVGGPRLRQWR